MILLTFSFIYSGCSSNSSSSSGSEDDVDSVIITGTIAEGGSSLVHQNIAAGDFSLIAIVGNTEDDTLTQSYEMVTIDSDGTFSIDVPIGTTTFALVNENENLQGILSADNSTLINTTSIFESEGDGATITANLNFSDGELTTEDLNDLADSNGEIAGDIADFGSEAIDVDDGGSDLDGDGVLDAIDMDRDGDGIPDILDRDTNGNGDINQVEGDIFSTCALATPRIFMNHKVDPSDSTNDDYLLNQSIEDNAEDDNTLTGVTLLGPPYALEDGVTLEEGGDNDCTGEDGVGDGLSSAADFDGELIPVDGTSETNFDFCGYLRGSPLATAETGDFFRYQITATDGDGNEVTENCATIISYMHKDAPENLTIEGNTGANIFGTLTVGADNILNVTATTPSSYPTSSNANGAGGTDDLETGFVWKYTFFALTTTCGQESSSDLRRARVTPGAAFSDEVNLATNTELPISSSGCWQFDLQIVSNNGDNVNIGDGRIRVCKNGSSVTGCAN